MKNKLCNISLFSAILTCVVVVPGNTYAESRVNHTYASAYNQAAMIREQQQYIDAQDVPVATTASATAELPVAVADTKLANQIKSNESEITISDLDRCAMIYPNGVFKWDAAQSGLKKSSKPGCVAVVNLIDANTNTILATTTLAAGDTMKCNINEFPESGYVSTTGEIVVPADEEPTLKDVESVMNKEQKQNAGFKIAAAALIGGLAGNMLGPKNSGDDKLLGTSNKQIGTTALGAGLAAGLMAASSYSGKVAGDTIKSTAVNATAGMMAGNMAAGMMGTDSVIATTTCTVDGVERDCIIGRYSSKSSAPIESKDGETDHHYWTNKEGRIMLQCDKNNANCTRISGSYIEIELEDTTETATLDRYSQSDWEKVDGKQCLNSEDTTNTRSMTNKCGAVDNAIMFAKVKIAYKAENSRPGYAVFARLPSKALGYKMSDWDALQELNPEYYRRHTNDGSVGEIAYSNDDEKENIVFTPSEKNAQDGSVIDISNEARAKATLIGTGVGAALGGISGYQGAQNEIIDRWLSAITEYNDSLLNYACMTGGRFLANYNGIASIDSMPTASVQEAPEQ